MMNIGENRNKKQFQPPLFQFSSQAHEPGAFIMKFGENHHKHPHLNHPLKPLRLKNSKKFQLPPNFTVCIY